MKAEKIWEGQPSYVFKITMLESDSYHDPLMGFASPLNIYIAAVGLTIAIIQGVFNIDIPWLLIAVLLLGGLVVPDIFIWSKKSSLRYIVTSKNLLVLNDGTLHKEVLLDSILNIYSIDENRKLESLVITYKEPIEEKVEKLKLYQIAKADQVSTLLKVT